MQTIKITPTFKATLDAITAAGKTPWVIINEDYAVNAYPNRSAARAEWPKYNTGRVVKASEINFQVVDLAAQAKTVTVTAPASSKPLFPAAPPAAPAVPTQTTTAELAKHPKIPLTRESTIERPCKRVWHIADEMKEAAGGLEKLRRKDVLARCVAEGIAYYTARTQYQLWLTIQNGGSI